MSRFDNYPGAPYTPYDDCPPDDICANCGAQLPDDPQEGTVEYEGFCSNECALGEPAPVCIRPMFALLCAELGRDDPEGWSRSIYKGTDCGAWLSLHSHDTISIGSIVEGCDYDAETVTLSWPFTAEQLWSAVQAVEDSVNEIWNNTHGCEKCAELFGFAGEYGEIEGCDGMTPVHLDCPECEGHGVAI